MTWGARHEDGGPAVAAGAPLPPTGKPLGKLNTDDLTAVVERGLKLYSMLDLKQNFYICKNYSLNFFIEFHLGFKK